MTHCVTGSAPPSRPVARATPELVTTITGG